MSQVVLFGSLSGLSLFNVVLHSIIVHHLKKLHRVDETPQILYLLHLSVVEIFDNVCWFFIDVLQTVQLKVPSAILVSI